MKIVQFSNGKYGVRTRWSFGWFFIDFKPDIVSERPINDSDFHKCQVDTYEEANTFLKSKKLIYKILESI